jgi:hypothetical protein
VKRDIRIIHWLDSCMCHAQVSAAEFPTPSRLVSVGVVVAETKRYITLARDTELSNGDARGLISIPRCAVLKERRL